jgi:hypothetical protein
MHVLAIILREIVKRSGTWAENNNFLEAQEIIEKVVEGGFRPTVDKVVVDEVLLVWGHCQHCIKNGVKWRTIQDPHECKHCTITLDFSYVPCRREGGVGDQREGENDQILVLWGNWIQIRKMLTAKLQLLINKESKIEFLSECVGLKTVTRKENNNIRSQLSGYQLEDEKMSLNGSSERGKTRLGRIKETVIIT